MFKFMVLRLLENRFKSKKNESSDFYLYPLHRGKLLIPYRQRFFGSLYPHQKWQKESMMHFTFRYNTLPH